MDSRFNKVVIKKSDDTRRDMQHNLWFSIHPLKLDYIRSSDHPGNYGRIEDWTDTPQYIKDLMDTMWSEIPGLTRISFSNGKCVVQHEGVFDDNDIADVVIHILTPVLEANLALLNL